MNSPWLVVIFAGIAQFAVFVRWLHRRIRDDEIQRAFVREIAANHLPHLYHALHQIAARLHIELREPPPVRSLDINGTDSRDSRSPQDRR